MPRSAPNFRAKGAKFLNACQAKTFAQMKVGQKVYLEEVTICCDFDLSYGDFHDLEISGVVKPNEPVATSTMNLSKLNLTVSQSEAGFERVYQSSMVMPLWRISLGPGRTWETDIRIRIE